MATARILLLLFCTAPAFGHWLPHRHLLRRETEAGTAAKIIAIAEKEIHVREQGRNAGPRVETYLRYVGLGKGHAWCAAFVSWLHGQAGSAQPRSGWSPSLFPASRCIPLAKPAAVFGIYVPAVKRIAHVGLVTGLRGDWIEALEGNTNPAGSREGDGVYRRLRHRRAINRYAYYL